MSDQLPDETALVIPDSWRKAMHPRRDRSPAMPNVVLDLSARERLDAVLPAIKRVFGAGQGEEKKIFGAARAYLRGEADPTGAAAVARLEILVTPGRPSREPWIDTWVAEHGLAFAACACAAVDRVVVTPQWRSGSYAYSIEYGKDGRHAPWAVEGPGRRMRALLAAADESDYAEAVERLADHRPHPMSKLVVSYLVPTQQEWVEECLALTWLSLHGRRLLWCAIGSAEQIGRLARHGSLGPYEEYQPEYGFLPGMLATVVEGVGPAIAPQVAKVVDDESDVRLRKVFLDVLAALPTDEAFELMAERLDHRDVRNAMVAMMERFPRRALRMLAPLAGGASKRARAAAILLDEHLRDRPELAAAVNLPAQARSTLEAMAHTRVAEAAMDDLPKALTSGQIQAPPTWAAPALMPQLLLQGRSRALPAQATARLITALSKTSPGRAPAAGARAALEACDQRSLAEFGWALFDRWRTSGEVSENGWPLSQLRWTGDEEIARRLGAMVRTATWQDGYKLAQNALVVLAAIGSDVALMQLRMVAENAKPKGLKKKARKLHDQVWQERGLTPEQVADRLVPDFGLDANGRMTLDYGPRRFMVGFDEALRPQVIDENGNLRKSLPKPGVKDNSARASAAYRVFNGLKKDVRTLATEQIRRMERAMTEQRRWEIGDFREFLVGHPLLWHVVRRLVWSLEDGGATAAFRVAEDRTLADVNDDVLTWPTSGTVHVAHPVRLGERVDWAHTFADYEILQPFPQLSRATYTLGMEDRAVSELKEFEGRPVTAGGLLGLERQGWERGPREGGGMHGSLSLKVPEGHTIVIEISHGIPAWNPGQTEDQTLTAVWITESSTNRQGTGRACFGDLDVVTISELLLTLNKLTAAAE